MTLPEQNLFWLQEFYAFNIKTLEIKLPEYISDEHIKPYDSFDTIPFISELLKISTIGNPGWSLCFYSNNKKHKNKELININFNLGLEANDDWLLSNKVEKYFKLFGGPLYLTIILEVFRCWIEEIPFIIQDINSFRNKLKANNSLLSWLEEFYFSCCDRNEYGAESYLSINLISVASGWVVNFLLEEIELNDKFFDKVFIQESEGTIECYKKDAQFIIRAHPRGLIKGLTIFKEWVEN